MLRAQPSRSQPGSPRPNLIWGRTETISFDHEHTERVMRAPFHKVSLGDAAAEHGGSTYRGPAIVVPAGRPHRIVARSEHVAIVQLDVRRYSLDAAERLAKRWKAFAPDRDDLFTLYEDAVTHQQRALDLRVERAAHLLASGASIGEVASAVQLSAGRLAHLFKQGFGMSARVFRGWLRLRAALPGIFAGIPVTQVAYDSGFADAAHLTRTCRGLLGECPSRLASYHVRLVIDGSRIVDCDEEKKRRPKSAALSVISAALGPC